MKNEIHLRKALVIGSTGMIGSELVKQLCDSADFEKIISFVRRPSGFSHPRLNELIVDFDKPESWKHLVKGDVLFSSMGTTLATAGSKEKQYKVDCTYQYEAAQMAAENAVPVYVLVSSMGASANGGTFYLKMKGKLDEEVQKLAFETVHILRPAQLYGNRIEKRTAEALAVKLMLLMNKIGLFRKLKPIHASEMAVAMQKLALQKTGGIHTLDTLFKLSK